MALTPTYSWPLPDNTDLVKDGAEAIRDLGNAIDTTVSGLGSGLVHIETQSVSAVSAINFNDVFTSTFDNYKVIVTGLVALGTVALQIRMRSGGIDNTAASYNSQALEVIGTGTTAVRTTSQTSGRIGVLSTSRQGIGIEIYLPNVAVATAMTSQTILRTGTAIQAHLDTAGHDVASAFDGFTLFPASSTFTGSISVYGYRK